MKTNPLTVAAALSLALTSAVGAQPRQRMNEGRQAQPRVSDATVLLNARRALNLTPRQVARLDSIERAQLAGRAAVASRLRAKRDSLCANRRPCVISPEERLQMRGLAGANGDRSRLLLRDSSSRVAALAVLDSSQRSLLPALRQRAMRASNGYASPRNRMLRGRDGRGLGPRWSSGRGMRPGGRYADPRFRRGDAWAPRGPGGFGPGRGLTPQGRGGMGPRFAPRRGGQPPLELRRRRGAVELPVDSLPR